jgi:hypothetical protein
MQRRGHGEDDVEVGDRQQVPALCCDPSGLVETLALGTVPVPTGVVEGLLAAAVVANLEVPAEHRRAAHDDVTDRPASIAAESGGGRSVLFENVGELWTWAAREGHHEATGGESPGDGRAGYASRASSRPPRACSVASSPGCGDQAGLGSSVRSRLTPSGAWRSCDGACGS